MDWPTAIVVVAAIAGATVFSIVYLIEYRGWEINSKFSDIHLRLKKLEETLPHA